MAQTGHVATLLVPVDPPDASWELYAGKVPQSELHTAAVDLLGDILKHWLQAATEATHSREQAALARIAELEAELARRGG